MSLPRFFEASRHPLARDTVIIAFPKGGGGTMRSQHSRCRREDAGAWSSSRYVIMMVVVVEKQTKVKHSDRHFCKAKPPLPFPPTLEV